MTALAKAKVIAIAGKAAMILSPPAWRQARAPTTPQSTGDQ